MSIEPSPSSGPERRRKPRHRPVYTTAEIRTLSIHRVLLAGDCLYCLLSDGKALWVPLRISPVVAGSTLHTRYQWQIAEKGKALVWTRGNLEERLRLPAMLAFPGSEISTMPDES